MSSEVRKVSVPPNPSWLKPYDPADSPGPIPSVREHFRRGREVPPPPSPAALEAARYTVVLVPPEATEMFGEDRGEAGLRMYRDTDWDHAPAYLDEAVKLIEENCGEPVVLVERHSDLTYWTARLRNEDE